ncbi:MAG: ATP-binding cassette domain-containing protein [Bacilli bacterium]|nr:ATP-binding cassette domain-containing protein [Bacilli bacterium]
MEEKVAPENVCISLQHINKIYPNHVQAVYDFNLDIKEKEFIVFVGPSGCGKSTTLRMVAGLEDITYGDLYINGEFANTLLPKTRDIAMVFQSYALYPNMTVYDNMAFALKVKHMSKAEINERVVNAARILEIEEYLGRKPAELSGGQRQRVALGRAIVRNAKVFLMDEPLSNLDAKLRVQMRSEIVSLHNKLGATTIYVTHDQTEAMTMASRIVVMSKGYVQQIGTPREIYNNPNNIFVATFIGAPAMNMINVQIKKDGIVLPDGLIIPISKEQKQKSIDFLNAEIALIEGKNEELEEQNIALTPADEKEAKKAKGIKNLAVIELNKEEIEANNEKIRRYQTMLSEDAFDAVLGVRPEDIVSLNASQILKNVSKPFTQHIEIAELLGNEYYAYSNLGEKRLIAKVSANEDIEPNSDIEYVYNLDKIHLFDIESTKRMF